MKNKTEARATGGGPNKMYTFSASEEAVISLMSLDTAVNHDGSVFGLPSITPPEQGNLETAAVIDDEDIENIENILPAGTSTPRALPRSNPKRNKSIETADLLRQQTEYLKQITANSEQCAKYARKHFHLEEDKFQYKKEYLLREEKRNQRELEYQLATLEFKKRKLDLLESSASKNTE